MRLFIAEKPELAKAIVDGLGGGIKKDGYYDCGDDYVTWCYGHMLMLQDPEDYDPKYKNWTLDHLPIAFIPWKLKVNPSSKDQLKIIIKLLEGSTSCVGAGDPDPEGQNLIDEILEYVGYSKPCERILINDNNTKLVQKALDNLTPNKNYVGLYHSTLARSVCDQLYGYNMTRLYTLKAQEKGYQGVLSVGRVQTPVLGLVVRRDLEHESHTKSFYYGVSGIFTFGDCTFQAKYNVDETDPIDEKNRLLDRAFAMSIKADIASLKATIEKAATSNKKTNPPLPFNLLKLQAEASRKFGYKPEQVKNVTQALREKYKLITYNRSDCQYLNDEHHESASAVLKAIGETASLFSNAINAADPSIKSKAFNSSKVSAHHGIIPTEATANFSSLSEPEQKIYLLIARAYIAQFFPPYEYTQTDLLITCGNKYFSCRSNVPINQGWKALYKNDIGNQEVSDDDTNLNSDLTPLYVGQIGECNEIEIVDRETKPQPRYTMDTLLNDLTRVAKYIKDPALKKSLIERDKDKTGEHGGIGTSATRDTIISGLFEREFLTENGKEIISTQIARDFYSIIPDEAKYPDMTALWHQKQLLIESGNYSYIDFINELVEYIQEQITNINANGLGDLNIKVWACPECSKPMRKIKGNKGFFWGCTGYQEGCKTALPDKNGTPYRTNKPSLKPSEQYKCGSCGEGLIRRPSKKKYFWGCSKYPDCSQSYPDAKGRPIYPTKKVS